MSKHTKLASDSARLCIVVPKLWIDEMKSLVCPSLESLSSVCRECIAIGMSMKARKDKRKENRNA